jgi:hypothetical protein
LAKDGAFAAAIKRRGTEAVLAAVSGGCENGSGAERGQMPQNSKAVDYQGNIER